MFTVDLRRGRIALHLCSLGCWAPFLLQLDSLFLWKVTRLSFCAFIFASCSVPLYLPRVLFLCISLILCSSVSALCSVPLYQPYALFLCICLMLCSSVSASCSRSQFVPNIARELLNYVRFSFLSITSLAVLTDPKVIAVGISLALCTWTIKVCIVCPYLF